MASNAMLCVQNHRHELIRYATEYASMVLTGDTNPRTSSQSRNWTMYPTPLANATNSINHEGGAIAAPFASMTNRLPPNMQAVESRASAPFEDSFLVRLSSSRPVSYTHLDVYKRQEHH